MSAKSKIISSKIVKEVHVTNEYGRFKTMPGNRNVDPRHVKQLQKLMLANGNLTHEFPIVVDAEGFVIDGQHRLEALQGLGWEVGYRVEESATIDTVRAINQGNRNWAWRDVAYSYSQRGNDNYTWFLSFVDQYGLRFSPSLMLAAGGGSRALEGLSKKFRAGDLVILDKGRAHDLAQQIVEIERLVQIYNQDFTYALAMVMRSSFYDQDRMMNKLRQQGDLLPEKARQSDYMRRLEDMYNFGFPEDNRVRLF